MAEDAGNEEDLLADLYYARKGAGFTSERARRAGILIDVLGGPGKPYPLMRERLLAAIQTNVGIHTVLDDGRWVQTTEHYRTLCLYEGVEYLEFSTDIPAMVRNDKPTRIKVVEDGRGRTIRFHPDTSPTTRASWSTPSSLSSTIQTMGNQTVCCTRRRAPSTCPP